MSRLIDADAFKEHMDYVCDAGGWMQPVTSAVIEYVKKNIDAEKTVDAVHVFRWIGCKERLPNVEEPVIVCFRWSCYGDYLIGRLERDLGNPIWHFEDFDMSGEDFDDVIAWMPLPQPYEMDGVTENG